MKFMDENPRGKGDEQQPREKYKGPERRHGGPMTVGRAWDVISLVERMADGAMNVASFRKDDDSGKRDSLVTESRKLEGEQRVMVVNQLLAGKDKKQFFINIGTVVLSKEGDRFQMALSPHDGGKEVYVLTDEGLLSTYSSSGETGDSWSGLGRERCVNAILSLMISPEPLPITGCGAENIHTLPGFRLIWQDANRTEPVFVIELDPRIEGCGFTEDLDSRMPYMACYNPECEKSIHGRNPEGNKVDVTIVGEVCIGGDSGLTLQIVKCHACKCQTWILKD